MSETATAIQRLTVVCDLSPSDIDQLVDISVVFEQCADNIIKVEWKKEDGVLLMIADTTKPLSHCTSLLYKHPSTAQRIRSLSYHSVRTP